MKNPPSLFETRAIGISRVDASAEVQSTHELAHETRSQMMRAITGVFSQHDASQSESDQMKTGFIVEKSRVMSVEKIAEKLKSFFRTHPEQHGRFVTILTTLKRGTPASEREIDVFLTELEAEGFGISSHEMKSMLHLLNEQVTADADRTYSKTSDKRVSLGLGVASLGTTLALLTGAATAGVGIAVGASVVSINAARKWYGRKRALARIHTSLAQPDSTESDNYTNLFATLLTQSQAGKTTPVSALPELVTQDNVGHVVENVKKHTLRAHTLALNTLKTYYTAHAGIRLEEQHGETVAVDQHSGEVTLNLSHEATAIAAEYNIHAQNEALKRIQPERAAVLDKLMKRLSKDDPHAGSTFTGYVGVLVGQAVRSGKLLSEQFASTPGLAIVNGALGAVAGFKGGEALYNLTKQGRAERAEELKVESIVDQVFHSDAAKAFEVLIQECPTPESRQALREQIAKIRQTNHVRANPALEAKLERVFLMLGTTMEVNLATLQTAVDQMKTPEGRMKWKLMGAGLGALLGSGAFQDLTKYLLNAELISSAQAADVTTQAYIDHAADAVKKLGNKEVSIDDLNKALFQMGAHPPGSGHASSTGLAILTRLQALGDDEHPTSIRFPDVKGHDQTIQWKELIEKLLKVDGPEKHDMGSINDGQISYADAKQAGAFSHTILGQGVFELKDAYADIPHVPGSPTPDELFTLQAGAGHEYEYAKALVIREFIQEYEMPKDISDDELWQMKVENATMNILRESKRAEFPKLADWMSAIRNGTPPSWDQGQVSVPATRVQSIIDAVANRDEKFYEGKDVHDYIGKVDWANRWHGSTIGDGTPGETTTIDSVPVSTPTTRFETLLRQNADANGDEVRIIDPEELRNLHQLANAWHLNKTEITGVWEEFSRAYGDVHLNPALSKFMNDQDYKSLFEHIVISQDFKGYPTLEKLSTVELDALRKSIYEAVDHDDRTAVTEIIQKYLKTDEQLDIGGADAGTAASAAGVPAPGSTASIADDGGDNQVSEPSSTTPTATTPPSEPGATPPIEGKGWTKNLGKYALGFGALDVTMGALATAYAVSKAKLRSTSDKVRAAIIHAIPSLAIVPTLKAANRVEAVHQKHIEEISELLKQEYYDDEHGNASKKFEFALMDFHTRAVKHARLSTLYHLVDPTLAIQEKSQAILSQHLTSQGGIGWQTEDLPTEMHYDQSMALLDAIDGDDEDYNLQTFISSRGIYDSIGHYAYRPGTGLDLDTTWYITQWIRDGYKLSGENAYAPKVSLKAYIDARKLESREADPKTRKHIEMQEGGQKLSIDGQVYRLPAEVRIHGIHTDSNQVTLKLYGSSTCEGSIDIRDRTLFFVNADGSEVSMSVDAHECLIKKEDGTLMKWSPTDSQFQFDHSGAHVRVERSSEPGTTFEVSNISYFGNHARFTGTKTVGSHAHEVREEDLEKIFEEIHWHVSPTQLEVESCQLDFPSSITAAGPQVHTGDSLDLELSQGASVKTIKLGYNKASKATYYLGKDKKWHELTTEKLTSLFSTVETSSPATSMTSPEKTWGGKSQLGVVVDGATTEKLLRSLPVEIFEGLKKDRAEAIAAIGKDPNSIRLMVHAIAKASGVLIPGETLNVLDPGTLYTLLFKSEHISVDGDSVKSFLNSLPEN